MDDLSGKKFGLLKPIKLNGVYISPKGKRDNIWYCECECGNFKNVRASCLKSGSIKSCGCLTHKKKGNRYDLSGEFGIGYDLQEREFYFDFDDYEVIKQYTWYQASNGYMRTSVRKEDGSWHQIQMHRLITKTLDEDILIDHINGCRYDNRKSNLRYANHSQNTQNSHVSNRNKTGIRGVTWDKQYNKWRVRIGVNGKRICVGSYSNFEDAVVAREKAEIKYYGEYRSIN